MEAGTVIELNFFNYSSNQSDPAIKPLLGTIISPKKVVLPKNKRKSFVFRLRYSAIKDAGILAISSIKSLYQRILIPKKSVVKRYWDIVIELILGYNVITTLYFLAYAYPGYILSIFDLICWILFIADIFLSFFTESINNKGESLKTFKKISKNYFKSWLVPDILAIIPLHVFGHTDIEYLLRMIRIIKLPGVLNITDGTGVSYLLTYLNFGKRGKDGKIFYSLKVKILASFVQIFVTLFFIIYFMGCFWFWFQNVVDNYKYSKYANENFNGYYRLSDMESDEIALRSSYFMLTIIASVGYGDFLPKNEYEMVFVSAVMLFGVTYFGLITGNFINAITYFMDYYSKKDYLNELNSWMESIERLHGTIPAELKKEVSEHFCYYFANDRVKNLAKKYWEAKTLQDLIEINQGFVKIFPEKSYFEVLDNVFTDFFSTFQFYFTDSRFKYHIIPHIQPRMFDKSSFIIRKTNKIDEILFILIGDLSVGIEMNGIYHKLLIFEDGRTVIGDYNVLTKLASKFDYLSLTFLHCYSLPSPVFSRLLNELHKEDKENIMEIASKREINLKRLLDDKLNSIQMNRNSLVDFVSTHNAKNRNKVKYNKEEIHESLSEMEKQNYAMKSKSKGILKALGQMDRIRTLNISKVK